MTADVFDRATGEKLALADVIDTAAHAAAVNKAVAEFLELLLLFAPDELVPAGIGPVAIPVKWAALGQ